MVKERYTSVNLSIDDCTKDDSEEFFTKMHCVRIANLKRFYTNLVEKRNAYNTYWSLQVDESFSPFCSHFVTVEFTDTSSADKTTRKNHKNTSIFRLLTGILIIQMCEVLLVL